MQLDLWSDVACPWCYVGKRRLEAALARFDRPVDVRWRAFELDPGAQDGPAERVDYAERLARKYGTSRERAAEMVSSMTATAAEEGIELRFDRVRPTNTFDAHRLLALARERGRADAAHERVFRAYFTEGLAIGDRDVLASLAAEIGIDPGEARDVLAGDAYAADVRADEHEASRSGVNAVPHFRIGRARLAGAQPPDVLLRALGQAS